MKLFTLVLVLISSIHFYIVTGVKFPESRIKHLCKADVYMYADKISNVSFPTDAIKLCGAVCEGYQDTMIFDVGVKVKVINANCDYTGATIIEQHSANETHPAICPDLSTACVCTYNVRCNQRTRPITYTLTPNQKGYLRVEVADCGNSNVTWIVSRHELRVNATTEMRNFAAWISPRDFWVAGESSNIHGFSTTIFCSVKRECWLQVATDVVGSHARGTQVRLPWFKDTLAPLFCSDLIVLNELVVVVSLPHITDLWWLQVYSHKVHKLCFVILIFIFIA